MTKPQLYSLLGTPMAYPSAAFGTPDKRSAVGLYAFGDAQVAVLTARGYLEVRDAVAGSVQVSDG